MNGIAAIHRVKGVAGYFRGLMVLQVVNSIAGVKGAVEEKGIAGVNSIAGGKGCCWGEGYYRW